MARKIEQSVLDAIRKAVLECSNSASVSDIIAVLGDDIPLRTLQYRINYLVKINLLVRKGSGRWTIYSVPPITGVAHVVLPSITSKSEGLSISRAGSEVIQWLRKPLSGRHPVSYNHNYLDSYRPNVTRYLSESDRARLYEVGNPKSEPLPAGTYARHILNRLLIDLAWNSSRLEGNTYSLLETRRLIEFGEMAEGKDSAEAQMILNHKQAIAFLVDSAADIGFNRFTILNLHAILSQNLLEDSAAEGRLRYIPVNIEGSSFIPLGIPQKIEEYFDQILHTANIINDPFEQAFFIMAQLPYLQPFDDVNKRVSRLAANIPLIKYNFCPFSFTDVPADIYVDAMMGIYELNDASLLKDLFMWAYQKSALRYAAVRQSLGEPDKFRMKYQVELRAVIGLIVRELLGKKDAFTRIDKWSRENISPDHREQFRILAENELLSMHEGNFVRHHISNSEFHAWQGAWHGVR